MGESDCVTFIFATVYHQINKKKKRKKKIERDTQIGVKHQQQN